MARIAMDVANSAERRGRMFAELAADVAPNRRAIAHSVAPDAGEELTTGDYHSIMSHDLSWSVRGALLAPDLPGAEALSAASILSLLVDAEALDPEAIALVGASGSLTRREMLQLARNVASAVAGVAAPGQAVACLLPRNPEGVAAIIGCLISGRLCMILDPGHPVERQAALLADTAPAALLLAEPLRFAHAAPAVMLKDALRRPAVAWQPDFAWNPDAPLAVHFTSGSSGLPKGIVLSTRSTLYRAFANAETWGLTASDAVWSASAPVAGSGLSTMLAALCRGARAVLPDLGTAMAGGVLRLLEREAVTVAVLSAPMLRMLLGLERSRSAFRALRMLRIGAASLLRTDLVAWRKQLPAGCTISHAYSSTEALMIAQWVVDEMEVGGPEWVGDTVAAGVLQPGLDYALQDEDGHPCAPGQAGELVVRGRYVALGEWRGGRLVAGRMVPVADRPLWRQFRTGDRLAVRPDGMMQVLGRVDRQIKINGVRIEPAEIEAVLLAQEGVTDAAVVAQSGPDGGLVLHGFVVAAGADRMALVTALRGRLSRALPMAFRPAHLTVLNELPIMASGKVDLQSLATRT